MVSLRLDVGRPDDFCPLPGFLRHEVSEIGRRARLHDAADIGALPGSVESRVRFPFIETLVGGAGIGGKADKVT